MIFNKNNYEIINTKEVYIHDDVLEQLSFDRENRKLILDMHKYCRIKDNQWYKVDEKYKIIYNDVLGFTMTSCDFWGASERIDTIWVHTSKDYILIPELQKRLVKESFSSYDISIDYIESMISFISGDRLRVVSKEIVTEALKID